MSPTAKLLGAPPMADSFRDPDTQHSLLKIRSLQYSCCAVDDWTHLDQKLRPKSPHWGTRFSCDEVDRVIGYSLRVEEFKMAFTIHASGEDHVTQTLRLDAYLTAEKARALFYAGWDVRVTDQAGHKYSFNNPDGLIPVVDEASCADAYLAWPEKNEGIL